MVDGLKIPDYGPQLRTIQRELQEMSGRVEETRREMINSLQSELAPVIRSLGSLLQDNTEGLMKVGSAMALLQETTQTGYEALYRQLNDVIQSAGETEILTRMSNIKALEAQVEVEKQTLSESRTEIAETISKLENKYAELLDTLAQEEARRLREMDGHIYSLIEDEYRHEIQEPIADFREFYDVVKTHLGLTQDYRESLVYADLEKQLDAIETYLRELDTLESSLSEALDRDSAEPMRMAIPFVVTRIRNGRGEEQTRVDLPRTLDWETSGGTTRMETSTSETQVSLLELLRPHVEASALRAAQGPERVIKIRKERVIEHLQRYISEGRIPAEMGKLLIESVRSDGYKTFR